MLLTSHCELEPCPVGDWERARIAGCLGVGMPAGWGETEVLVGVSSRRLAPVQHRHLPARGLLSLFSLLRAFLLNVIKRNQAAGTVECEVQAGASDAEGCDMDASGNFEVLEKTAALELGAHNMVTDVW